MIVLWRKILLTTIFLANKFPCTYISTMIAVTEKNIPVAEQKCVSPLNLIKEMDCGLL